MTRRSTALIVFGFGAAMIAVGCNDGQNSPVHGKDSAASPDQSLPDVGPDLAAPADLGRDQVPTDMGRDQAPADGGRDLASADTGRDLPSADKGTSNGGMGGGGNGGNGSGGNGGTSGRSDAGPDGADVGGAGAKPLLGVYCGNDPAAVQQFESWLGREVDGILGYTGATDWADYDGSVGWAVGLWSDLDRRVFWSVPLIPKGASLDAAASGDFNEHYRKAAQTLSTYRPGEAEVYTRTGWEMNGDWFPWAAQGKEQAFIGAFRQFVTTFRSVSTRFVFEWNANIGNNASGAMNPEDGYPGDSYVDIIGMDFYWNTTWDSTDPVQAWDSMVNRPYGLKWHQTFAAAHGKPTSYSEWGMMSNEGGPYVERAKLWFESHPVVFHTYWNSDSDFKGKLSSDQYPDAGSAYRAAFGGP